MMIVKEVGGEIMNCVTGSIGTIVKILSTMIGDGFFTGNEESLINHPELAAYYL